MLCKRPTHVQSHDGTTVGLRNSVSAADVIRENYGDSELYSSRGECVLSRPLGEKSKVGGAADGDARTVHAIDIIFQLQYFVTCCLSSYVRDIFGLRSTFVCFPSTRKLMK
jgi:hypothetical protein